MREPREPRRRLEVVELRSRDGDSCVVAISDGRGGEVLLQLDPPYSSPQFLPDVGEPVVLDMTGPVPQVVARQLAVDAVGVREFDFDTITAMLFYGGKIIFGDPDGNHGVLDKDGIRLIAEDGTTIDLNTPTGNALITGEYRSAESGERFVINPDGVNPEEIRFYAATGPASGSIRAGTEAFTNLPTLNVEGAVGTDGFRGQLELGLDGAEFTYQLPTGTNRAGVYLGTLNAVLSVPDYGGVNVSTSEVLVSHSVGFRVAVGTQVRFQANATGIGFNGVTPIARRTVNAAATTNAEALTLINQLRALLVDVGLAQ